MKWPSPLPLALLVTAALRADAQQPARVGASTFLGVEHTYSWFEGPTDPWLLSSVWIGHRGPMGTFSARANLARRFRQTGEQVEFDAYPRLTDRAYLYLNGAFSASGLFPRNREAAEVFTTLPGAWEASLGLRALHFQAADQTVWLATGSVGKYRGNDWYSFRPYLRSKDGALEFSGTVNARRYQSDADNYVGLRAGYGSTPSDRVLTEQELGRTSSATAGVYGSREVLKRTIGTLALDYTREELTPSTLRNRWELTGGLRWQF